MFYGFRSTVELCQSFAPSEGQITEAQHLLRTLKEMAFPGS
jgi:hypothetical protein